MWVCLWREEDGFFEVLGEAFWREEEGKGKQLSSDISVLYLMTMQNST